MAMTTTCNDCGHVLPEPEPGTQCPLCGRPTSTAAVARAVAGSGVGRGGSALAYHYAQYADAWYEDALREARTGHLGDRHARRREIVFAVCCAESYLYEWAFAQVRGASSADNLYANIGKHLSDEVLWKPFNARWSNVIDSLLASGLLRRRPEVQSRGHAQDWERLLGYRNALIHASISKPVFGSGSVADPPLTNTDLADLDPG